MFLADVLTVIAIAAVFLVIIFMTIGFYVMAFGGGPFVPTPLPAVHKVLKAAKIKKGERVYDIGAGDGRFVHFAAKDYGADSVGFEMDPTVYFIAKLRQWISGWEGKMIRQNFLKHNFKDADVLVCYMMPKTLARYQAKFDKELKKGTRVVSYAFKVGDWKPEKIIPKEGKISKIMVYKIK
jgi:predicted RNA methylase